MDTGSPDGEYFADEAANPIPPKETWPDLTVSQMIDVKNQLQEKAWTFGNNPVISKALNQGIAQLDAMISLHGLS